MQKHLQACGAYAADNATSRPRRPAVPAMLMLAALALPGCGGLGALGGALGGGGGGAAPSAAVAQRPMEPLAQFAAQAREGQQEYVAPAPGAAPVPVRLVRGYNAASGRQCRELAVGGGPTARPALYCGDASGWAAARPLLRGGALARP